jgi:hypothetical protein
MVPVLVCAVLVVGGLVQAAPQTTAAPGPQSETATQFYQRYRAAVASATSTDDVVALWAADAANEYRNAPPDQRVDLAGIKRMNSMVSSVTVTHEAISVGAGTANATLSLEGIGTGGKKVTGTVHLVKQEGLWKLAQPEEWK